MNAENQMYRHFVLSQRKSRAESRTIYSPKYFSLMLTMIILSGTYQIKSKILDHYQLSLQDYILQMAAIIVAFLISSISQFIGHRILYITSYTTYSVFFILICLYELFPSAWVLFHTSRIVLLQQINIQIYGMWPNKFGRIFAELLFFYEVTKQIMAIIKNYDEYLICLIFIVIIGCNLIWLVCGQLNPIFKSINDFRSPETDSVLIDFFRLLRNIKIIIFTLLYFFCTLSLNIFRSFLGTIYQEFQKQHSTTLLLTALRILPISSIILIRAFVNLNLKSSFYILISLILLVTLLVIWLILFEVDYLANIDITTFLVLYFILLMTYNLQDIFMTPNYWQILINIGIRNLDFVAPYQLFAYGLAYVSFIFLMEDDNQLNLYLLQNFWIIILSLIGIIFNLSLIFYQFLGFKQYLYNTYTSQVEEDKFYIEIV